MTHLEEMEQEAKKVTEAITQFWGSVVRDGKLDKMNKWFAKGKGEDGDTKYDTKRNDPSCSYHKVYGAK